MVCGIPGNVSVNSEDTTFEIDIHCSDADSPEDKLSIGMSVFDFRGEILDSKIDDATNTTTFVVDTSEFTTNELVNLVLNVSDGYSTIYLPYILMTSEMGTNGEIEIRMDVRSKHRLIKGLRIISKHIKSDGL